MYSQYEIDSRHYSQHNYRMQSPKRTFTRLAGLIGLLAVVAALPSCAGPASGKKLDEPAKIFSTEGRTLTYKEVLDIVNAQSRQFETLKADIKIELRSEVLKDVQYCNAKLIMMRPDKIRMKGFQPFVPTLFDIASNGRKYSLYFPQDKKVYQGEYYKNDVWRPSPLDIDPAQLSQAFLVDGVVDGQEGQVVFVERDAENQYVVFQLDGWQNRYYLKRKVFVDSLEQRVIKQQYFVNDGNLSFEVEYDKYLDDKRIALPQQISFYRPTGNCRAIAQILRYELNQPCSPGLFELDDVQGAEVTQVK